MSNTKLSRRSVLVHLICAVFMALAATIPRVLQAAEENMTTKLEPAAGTAGFPIQILDMTKSTVFRNPGKESAQILWSGNSPDAQVTITRVTMQPGAISERHAHAEAEQTWIMEQGRGTLLLGDGKTVEIKAGDLIRTPPKTTHGVINSGKELLIYTSITTPPENMEKYYTDTNPKK